MFEWPDPIPKHRAFWVGGPQRSGTHFCAAALANDFDLEYVWDASGWSLSHLQERLSEGDIAIPCPDLSTMASEIDLGDALFIWMRRPTDEIETSQHRIGYSRFQMLRPGMHQLVLQNYEGKLCERRYQHWVEEQRDKFDQWIELDYHALKDHPIYVPKGKRAKFKDHQVSPHSPTDPPPRPHPASAEPQSPPSSSQ